MSEGKREGLVHAVPHEQQARELGPACPPSWAPLHQDNASFPKSSIVSAFVGAGCLVGAAGLRHDQQHLLLPCCCCARVRGVGFFFFIFCIAPRWRGVCLFSCFVGITAEGQNHRNSFIFRKRPGIVVNAPGRLFRIFSPAKSYPPGGRLLALLRFVAWYIPGNTFILLIEFPSTFPLKTKTQNESKSVRKQQYRPSRRKPEIGC